MTSVIWNVWIKRIPGYRAQRARQSGLLLKALNHSHDENRAAAKRRGEAAPKFTQAACDSGCAARTAHD
jgi:hypothetical protein